MLRFLAVTPAYWDDAFSLLGSEREVRSMDPRMLYELQRAKLIKVRDGVNELKFASLSSEVGLTIKAGLTLDLLNKVRHTVSSNPRRRYELDDLWDGGSRARTAVSEVAEIMKKKDTDGFDRLIAYSIRYGGSTMVQHHRSHVIDVLLAATGISQNQLHDDCSKLGFPGGKTVRKSDAPHIRNVVPRTVIATNAIKKDSLDIDGLATTISKALSARLSSVNWEELELLVSQYLNLRAFNLTKGSSIDPLEDFIISALEEAGWKLEKSGIKSTHPLVGSVNTVFTAVAVKNNKKVILKCLFGDTGADHKAEEMEARLRMVALQGIDKKYNVVTVFVADGKWSSNNITSLVLGGWDYVVSVAEFHSLLASL
jgi:hypothetical protein